MHNYLPAAVVLAVAVYFTVVIVIFAFFIADAQYASSQRKKADIYAQRLDDDAKQHCTQDTFYASNFERCERIGVRP